MPQTNTTPAIHMPAETVEFHPTTAPHLPEQEKVLTVWDRIPKIELVKKPDGGYDYITPEIKFTGTIKEEGRRTSGLGAVNWHSAVHVQLFQSYDAVMRCPLGWGITHGEYDFGDPDLYPPEAREKMELIFKARDEWQKLNITTETSAMVGSREDLKNVARCNELIEKIQKWLNNNPYVFEEYLEQLALEKKIAEDRDEMTIEK
jgi:hypothetical protein